MEEIKEADIETLKQKLRGYTKEEICFNEPHFSQQLMVREGSVDEVVKHLLNPERLVYAYHEKGKYGDDKYSLYFEISNTRTMKIPVIFDRGNKKVLYVITYIMRYRPWQGMIKQGDR